MYPTNSLFYLICWKYTRDFTQVLVVIGNKKHRKNRCRFVSGKISERSVGNVRKKRDVAGALDGYLELSLVSCTSACNSSRENLCSLGDALSESYGILVIDVIDTVGAEHADFLSSLSELTLLHGSSLQSFSHFCKFSRTNSSSCRCGYASCTRVISSACPGESVSFGFRHQMPGSSPCLCSTSWMPGIHPAKPCDGSKKAALLSVICAARVSSSIGTAAPLSMIA